MQQHGFKLFLAWLFCKILKTMIRLMSFYFATSFYFIYPLANASA